MGRVWADSWMCTHMCMKPLVVENGHGGGGEDRVGYGVRSGG